MPDGLSSPRKQRVAFAAAMLGRRRAVGAVFVGLLVMGLAACGAGGHSAGAVHLPRLSVTTAAYPLAEAARQIGSNAVVVNDVVPPGEDPLTYRLPGAGVASVRSAAVAIEAGGGVLPWLHTAALTAQRDLVLPGQAGAYDWLDPISMVKTVSLIAQALQQADPAASSLFKNNAQGFAAELSSTGIDYESVLSTCPRRTIVTPDTAFAAMARDYGLTDLVVGTESEPGAQAVSAQAARVTASGATTVFSESWVSDATVDAVAAAAHVKVRSLDTLVGTPAGGWPAGATYITLLESNLGVLSSALGCPDQGSGS